MARILRCAFAQLYIRRAVPAAALLLAATALPGQAETLGDWKCTGNAGIPWDEQVVGCTNALKSGRFSGPGTVAALFDRGLAYHHKGDYGSAVADFTQAIALDPKFVLGYDARGDAYDAKGDRDRALADYNQAIALDPKYLLAYNSRGNIYEHKGDLDHAIADYNQAIALDPKFPFAYGGRGDVYKDKGDLDHAMAD